MSLSQWGWLVFLSVLWGGSFFFVGIAVHELPAFTIVLIRVALGAAVLVPIVLLSGLRLPGTLAGWWPFFVMAVLNNLIPFVAIVSSQKHIASGLASVLNATTPMWSVMLAWGVMGERPAANRIAGVLIGILGVAVLVGPDALTTESASLIGVGMMLTATFAYGLSSLWGRKLKTFPPLVTAASQLLCSTAMLLPLAIVVDRPWTLAMPSSQAIGALVGLAVLATSLAYIVFFHIMKVSGPMNAMLVTLLIPVSAIALGTVFLGETLLPRHVAGALIIALALLAIDGRLIAWARGRVWPAARS